MSCAFGLLDVVGKNAPVFVTLVLGLIGTLIALRQLALSRQQLLLSKNQHALARDKLRLDLFDKRHVAYEKLSEYFGAALKDGQVAEPTFMLLWNARYKARFLFGTEMDDFLERLWENGVELRSLYLKLHGEADDRLPAGDERSSAAREHQRKFEWLCEQMKAAQPLYGKYLRFD